jgi:general secretion pathway protein D
MKPILIVLALLVAMTHAGRGEDFQLSFKNADIKEVLALYEKLTGFHVITSNQVVGSLSVSTAEPVPKKKAVELIETALFEDGFSIVQNKPDTVHVLGVATNPSSAAIPTFTRPEDIPGELRVVRYVYKLKFRAPEKVMAVLQVHLAPSWIGVPQITIDPEVRAVVITERSSALRGLLKLLDELDQPPAK